MSCHGSSTTMWRSFSIVIGRNPTTTNTCSINGVTGIRVDIMEMCRSDTVNFGWHRNLQIFSAGFFFTEN